MPTIAYVVGARPNFIKMAPLIHQMRRRLPNANHVLIHTGQHYDRLMSDVFLEELDVPGPNYNLEVGAGSHAVQTARMLERLEPVLVAENPDLVVVPGDVNSTLAASLTAAKLMMPLAHLEAGLRSFDRTMPEEINRIIADEFSELLFAHSDEPVANLLHEGIQEERIHFVGNTMIDSLVSVENRFRSIDAHKKFGLRGEDYVLVTLHRPALVDGPLLHEAFEALRRLAHQIPVVFPVHPRTRQRIRMWPRLAGLVLTDPVGYFEFLSLEANAAAVLTDSGGVQEETTYLGVPCFTLRDNTERPITVRAGTNVVLGSSPSRIAEILPRLESWSAEEHEPPPLWDGHASERATEVIASFLERANTARALRALAK